MCKDWCWWCVLPWIWVSLTSFSKLNNLVESSLLQKVSKYVTCAILASCLSNLPSLILSPAALILVPSVAIRPSHFLFRRIWTLLTAQASAASLSDSQQIRQDKQERTEHFTQITTQTLDGWDDNAAGRHFEKIVFVKRPHLDRSYLVFRDCLFHLKPLSAERLGLAFC